MVDVVVSGPQCIKCRYRDQDPSTGSQQAASMFEGCCGIRQVFQHIQHENQIESLAGLKASIKRLSEDLIAPGTVGSQRCFVRFNTEDAAKP